MPNRLEKEKEKVVPRWFYRDLSLSSKNNIKQAVVNYILDRHLRHKLPKGNVETCKSVLPTLRAFEAKWTDVTHDNFNTGEYKAHQDYVDTARNLLKSRKELNGLLDDAEGKEKEEDDDQEDSGKEEEQEDQDAKNSNQILEQPMQQI